jgi:hypothetical protein
VGTTVTFAPANVDLDPTKKSDLVALFSGTNAVVKVAPGVGLTPAVGEKATFDAVLVENTTVTPPTLQINSANLHSFAVAKLKQDVKASYDKLVTLLKLGMQKIVVTDGRINTSLTFHVASTDSDSRDVSDTATSTSDRVRNWSTGGGIASTFSGKLFGFALGGRFGFSGTATGSSTQTSIQVHAVNEKSTAVTSLSFDITGALELHFRSDFFPSVDPATLKTAV